MAAPSLARVVLASTSPYRRELLQRLKLPFETVAPDVDERPAPDELPESLALRLAQAKAAAKALPRGIRHRSGALPRRKARRACAFRLKRRYLDDDAALAANVVIEMGGGSAVVREGQVVAQLAFPVAGLLSALPPQEVAREHLALVEAAGTVIEWEGKYRTFKALSGQCLACNAGPHLTDLGLTDGGTREVHRPFLRWAS